MVSVCDFCLLFVVDERGVSVGSCLCVCCLCVMHCECLWLPIGCAVCLAAVLIAFCGCWLGGVGCCICGRRVLFLVWAYVAVVLCGLEVKCGCLLFGLLVC